MTIVSLVVMEPGSEWPGQIGDCVNLIAFSQGGDALLRRTQEKLDELRRGRQDVRVAVLACNPDAEVEVDRCRAQVARALLTAVPRHRRAGRPREHRLQRPGARRGTP